MILDYVELWGNICFMMCFDNDYVIVCLQVVVDCFNQEGVIYLILEVFYFWCLVVFDFNGDFVKWVL